MRRSSWVVLLVLALGILMAPRAVRAHDPNLHPLQVLDAIGFDQRLDAPVPLDLTFLDERGQPVQLRHYFDGKPVILSMGYYDCPNLCPLTRRGLLASLQQLSFTAGEEFRVLAISIDPEETPELAARTHAETVQAYSRPGGEAGWHFLTGDHDAIDELSDAVGFRYAYDTRQEAYAHASGVIILTPEGTVSRYLFGLEYAPRDLRLALVEATANRIGTVIDQVLLFCYHYDPITGEYTMLIMNVLRLAGLTTVLVLGGLITVLLRRERRPMGVA
jgi:protein SCO1